MKELGLTPLTQVTDDDVEEMIRAVDEDANGEITIEEFKMMIGMG